MGSRSHRVGAQTTCAALCRCLLSRKETARTSILNLNRTLKLVVDTERVRHLFDLLRLFRVLDIHETPEEALDLVGAEAEA